MTYTAVAFIAGALAAGLAQAQVPAKIEAELIKIGPIVGNNYPVLEGIRSGERVITSGVQKLADGAPIQPVQPTAPQPQGRGTQP